MDKEDNYYRCPQCGYGDVMIRKHCCATTKPLLSIKLNELKKKESILTKIYLYMKRFI